MLQKPYVRSKAKNNAMRLAIRLEKWAKGDIMGLIEESWEIQSRLKTMSAKKSESLLVQFSRIMLLGQVGKAVKLINNNSDIKGVHNVTRKVKGILEAKHPKGKKAPSSLKLEITKPDPQPVIFDCIDAEAVHKVAKNVHGSGGPTLIDADCWKYILCSKSYGKASVQLCGAIAELAKKLSTAPVDHRFLTEFVACRLVPLDKGEDKSGKIGVRPVGVGEVLRGIVGKLIMNVIKDDIQKAAGPIQTCAGLKGGIEACIHATRDVWEEEGCEGVLMVDAENAFNTVNRKLALHNVRQLCPPFYQYLHNTYQEPAKLIVNDQKSVEYLSSDEGCTQGDVTAMAFYALGVQPLTKDLSSRIDTKSCRQMWYADDATAIGKLQGMKDCWDILCELGPGYGYYPKPSKTVLILKNPQLKKAPQYTFRGTGITISCESERHLGAVLGTENFKEKYVQGKVMKWVKDVEGLALIGEDDPQLAYSAFT